MLNTTLYCVVQLGPVFNYCFSFHLSLKEPRIESMMLERQSYETLWWLVRKCKTLKAKIWWCRGQVVFALSHLHFLSFLSLFLHFFSYLLSYKSKGGNVQCKEVNCNVEEEKMWRQKYKRNLAPLTSYLQSLVFASFLLCNLLLHLCHPIFTLLSLFKS